MRGIGELPTTAESSPLGCIGFMKAAFGVRFLPEDDFRRLLFRPPFLAAFFLDDFLAEDFRDEDFFLPLLFFFAAILSPGLVIGCRLLQSEMSPVSGANYIAVRRKQ
ncbi:MAG: hypothetical protein ACRENK_03565 [Gemmatimonadaceae bacterium]